MATINYKNLGQWAISKELFNWIEKFLPKGSTILEFGSGKGTGELTKLYKVISVEQDIKWVNFIQNENSYYIHAPLKDNWYDIDKVISGLQNSPWGDNPYDLILIDGPKGDAFRGGFDSHIDKFNTNVPIILDDTNRPKDKQHALSLAKQLDREYEEYTEGEKNFILIKPYNSIPWPEYPNLKKDTEKHIDDIKENVDNFISKELMRQQRLVMFHMKVIQNISFDTFYNILQIEKFRHQNEDWKAHCIKEGHKPYPKEYLEDIIEVADLFGDNVTKDVNTNTKFNKTDVMKIHYYKGLYFTFHRNEQNDKRYTTIQKDIFDDDTIIISI